MSEAPPFPTNVRVGYRDYRIQIWPRSEARSEDRFGLCSDVRALIQIDQQIVEEEPIKAANTLMHEILHACHAVGDLQKGDDEERIVRTIANQLSQVWRDNPGVIAYLDWAFGKSADV